MVYVLVTYICAVICVYLFVWVGGSHMQVYE